jgi:adenylylsulfate kinase
LWLTGLSGAGKSTLARKVGADLTQRGYPVEVLDGDEIRLSLSKGLGYSREDRDTNVRRIGFVARLLARNGVVAVVAVISPYRDARREVRRTHEGRFVEVYVQCSLEELVKRDVKGLYARALRGELQHFSGVSDPYEAPDSPEIIVNTDQESADQSSLAILSWLEQHQLIG